MNLRLDAAAHAFNTTPDELLALNLGRLVTALDDGLITPEQGQELIARHRRGHALLANATVIANGVDYGAPGHVTVNHATVTHGNYEGSIRTSFDVGAGAETYAYLSGDEQFDTPQQLRDAISVLADLADGWAAMQPTVLPQSVTRATVDS